jgi:hypothetical protein
MGAIPRYVAVPLNGFLNYLKESMRLLHMSMRGISMITSIPHSLVVLGEHRYSENPPNDPAKRKEAFQKKLEAAEVSAKFAEKELEEGFPLLHAHTLVGAWSALESAIEDALVRILMNEPDLLQSEPFSKVRIPLAEFEALEKEERIRFLIEEIERSRGLPRRQGADGFETLLGYVNLSGAVNPDVKKAIWELSHVRNVLVHRGSVADRRLVQSCPWMGLSVGDKVTITHETLGKYYAVLSEYLVAILNRLCAKYDDVDGERVLRSDAEESENTKVL